MKIPAPEEPAPTLHASFIKSYCYIYIWSSDSPSKPLCLSSIPILVTTTLSYNIMETNNITILQPLQPLDISSNFSFWWCVDDIIGSIMSWLHSLIIYNNHWQLQRCFTHIHFQHVYGTLQPTQSSKYFSFKALCASWQVLNNKSVFEINYFPVQHTLL